MFEIAWQNIVRAPARFASLAGAIAISVMLVLVGCGLYLGLLDGIVSYVNSLPGEVVVLEEGASVSMSQFASSLSRESIDQVRALPGVAEVRALHGRPVLFEVGGREALVFTIGLYRNESFGGPVELLEGKRRPRLSQIVIDRVLAHDLGLQLGDVIRKGSIKLRVVGIAQGGNTAIGTYAFVHRGDLMLAGVSQPSYLFVDSKQPDALALIEQINSLPGLKALPRARFVEENRAVARRIILPVIALLVGIGVVVAAGVVGLTLQSATLERKSEFGLLEAIGLSRAQRYRIVLYQSGLATGAGLLLGLLLGQAVSIGFVEIQPRFLVSLSPTLVWSVVAGTLAVGLCASLLPVRLLARLDPGLVFRV